jgi:putative hydrolase of the HAD superfamily
MTIKVDHNSCFVFDLDDTLYPEIDYLKSAYHAISQEISPEHGEMLFLEMLKIHSSGGNAFKYVLEKFPDQNLTVEKLLYLYRNHKPVISLREGVLKMLLEIRKKNGTTGIITDGRGITQRNKIKALGIENYVDKLVISEEFGYEKPSPELFKPFIEKDIEKQYYYFGDNIFKDFITPKKLSWFCIGVLDENNIHHQNLSEFLNEFLPHIFINSFTEVEII